MTDVYTPPVESAPIPPTGSDREAFFRRNEFREMAWKLAAVCFLIQGLASLSSSIFHYDAMSGGMNVLLAIMAAGSLAGSVFCYLVSRKYCALPDEDRAINGPIVLQFQSVIFSVVGLYFIIVSGPTLLALILSSIQQRNLHGDILINYSQLSEHGLRFLFGLALFFGTDKVQKLWFRFRHYGR